MPPLLNHIRETAGIVCMRNNVRVLDLLVFNFTCRLTFATANPFLCFFVLFTYEYATFFTCPLRFIFLRILCNDREREKGTKHICTRLRIEHSMMKQSRFDGVAWNKVIVDFHRFRWLLLRHRFYLCARAFCIQFRLSLFVFFFCFGQSVSIRLHFGENYLCAGWNHSIRFWVHCIFVAGAVFILMISDFTSFLGFNFDRLCIIKL